MKLGKGKKYNIFIVKGSFTKSKLYRSCKSLLCGNSYIFSTGGRGETSTEYIFDRLFHTLDRYLGNSIVLTREW